MGDALQSWNDTATRQAIADFVETAARDLPPEERVAVFDNDGTLWCEKPMPIELGFILGRFAAMAEEDESLRTTQPWQAAYEKDYAWLGGVIEKHYAGDDSDVKVVIGGILQAFAGQTVDEYTAAAEAFLAEAPHPTLGRRLRDCGYVPMLRFAGGKGRPALRLLVLHDDPEREFDYVKGAEHALERAKAESWTVVSVKDAGVSGGLGAPVVASNSTGAYARPGSPALAPTLFYVRPRP